jgi:hypothetical protein
VERTIDFIEATGDYESWLAGHLTILGDDLREKHRRMSEGLFPFLRATFYRWMQLWPIRCPELALAPPVLAVGDIHMENYGTWRDREGRLAWGVNDFDEADPLPYTLDLVRLAASMLAAQHDRRIRVKPRLACRAIVRGYHEWLIRGGRPFVLIDKPKWLWTLAQQQARGAITFWRRLMRNPLCHDLPFPEARRLLEDRLPEPNLAYEVRLRRAGLGSLGRPRYVALMQWRGGTVAREVKAMAPSAVCWADKNAPTGEGAFAKLMAQAVRSPDENFKVQNGWVARRLAPDFIKIEMSVLPRRNLLRLLRAMGRELANIHLASRAAIPTVLDDLQKRDRHDAAWLLSAAEGMTELLEHDWKQWKKAHPAPVRSH